MWVSGFSILVSICCFVISSAQADPVDRFREAQRIVVITEEEGIHYAQFCAFYELRGLLAESIGNVSEAVTTTDSPLFEVRAISKAGEATAYVGDHWISTDSGTALLPSVTYDRLVELVDKRRGQGVAKGSIDATVQQALNQIQRPTYVEQNMCANRKTPPRT